MLQPAVTLWWFIHWRIPKWCHNPVSNENTSMNQMCLSAERGKAIVCLPWLTVPCCLWNVWSSGGEIATLRNSHCSNRENVAFRNLTQVLFLQRPLSLWIASGTLHYCCYEEDRRFLTQPLSKLPRARRTAKNRPGKSRRIFCMPVHGCGTVPTWRATSSMFGLPLRVNSHKPF